MYIKKETLEHGVASVYTSSVWEQIHQDVTVI